MLFMLTVEFMGNNELEERGVKCKGVNINSVQNRAPKKCKVNEIRVIQ